MHSMKSIPIVLLAVAVAVSLFGCGDPAGPDTSDPGPKPPVGTEYLFSIYVLDSNGVPVPVGVGSDIVRVTASDETFANMTGVVSFIHEKSRREDHIRPNESGDFLLYAPGFQLGASPTSSDFWFVYKPESGWESAARLYDTLYATPEGEEERLTVDRHANYVGRKRIQSPAGSFECIGFKERIDQILYREGSPVRAESQEETFWYASRAGYIIQRDLNVWAGDSVSELEQLSSTRDLLVSRVIP